MWLKVYCIVIINHLYLVFSNVYLRQAVEQDTKYKNINVLRLRPIIPMLMPAKRSTLPPCGPVLFPEWSCEEKTTNEAEFFNMQSFKLMKQKTELIVSRAKHILRRTSPVPPPLSFRRSSVPSLFFQSKASLGVSTTTKVIGTQPSGEVVSTPTRLALIVEPWKKYLTVNQDEMARYDDFQPKSDASSKVPSSVSTYKSRYQTVRNY